VSLRFHGLKPRLLGHAVLAEAPTNPAKGRGLEGVLTDRLGRGGWALGKRLNVLAEKAAVPPRCAIYPEVTGIGPLAQRRVAYIQQAAGIAEREPVSAAVGNPVRRTDFYHFQTLKSYKNLCKSKVISPERVRD
jgi:hypothetical protein